MELIIDGLVVMVIGMSVVFLFLVLLVIMMHVNAKIIAWYNKKYPEPVPKAAGGGAAPRGDDLSEIALVIAAVKSFGNKG